MPVRPLPCAPRSAKHSRRGVVLPDLWFPHAWKRASAAILVVGSVALGVAVDIPAQAAPGPVGDPAAAPAVGADGPTPEQAASAQAQRTGAPVEVVALRTEDEIVVANPDGSFTTSR